jgi:hypothetical protein
MSSSTLLNLLLILTLLGPAAAQAKSLYEYQKSAFQNVHDMLFILAGESHNHQRWDPPEGTVHGLFIRVYQVNYDWENNDYCKFTLNYGLNKLHYHPDQEWEGKMGMTTREEIKAWTDVFDVRDGRPYDELYIYTTDKYHQIVFSEKQRFGPVFYRESVKRERVQLYLDVLHHLYMVCSMK